MNQLIYSDILKKYSEFCVFRFTYTKLRENIIQFNCDQLEDETKECNI